MRGGAQPEWWGETAAASHPSAHIGHGETHLDGIKFDPALVQLIPFHEGQFRVSPCTR
jgi:hypothetical protein